MRYLPRLALAGLLLGSLALPACRPAPLTTPTMPQLAIEGAVTPVAAATGTGQLSVAIRWPARSERSIQAIPAAANGLELIVRKGDGTEYQRLVFNRPSTQDSLVATASLTIHVASTSYQVQAFAYRETFATDSIRFTADRIIAQGTQENVAVTLNRTTPVKLTLDPDVTVAGIGGTGALGNPPQLNLYQPVPDPRGPAVWTELLRPANLAFDPIGKYLFFTEDPENSRYTEGQRVVRLSLRNGSYGTLTSLAGGMPTTVYRDVDAVTALDTVFKNPRGAVMDKRGTIYIADSGNHRIRMIYNGDRIKAFAGTGLAGDLFDARQNLPAINSSFNEPCGLGYDATMDRMFVADFGTKTVRMINLAGANSPVSYLAGGGFEASSSFIPGTDARIEFPRAVAGNDTFCYVGTAVQTGAASGSLYQINLANGQTRVIAGFGQEQAGAVGNQFRGIEGVALGPTGLLYFSDTGGNIVWRLDPTDNNSLTRIAGTGALGNSGDTAAAVDATLNKPSGLLVDGGFLYICDRGNHRVRRVNLTNGNIYHFSGLSDGSGGIYDAGANGFKGAHLGPLAIASVSTGVVLDADANRLRRYYTDGTLATLAGTGGNNRLTRGAGLNGRNLFLRSVADLTLGYPTSGQANSVYVLDSDFMQPGEMILQLQNVDQVDPTESGFFTGVGPANLATRIVAQNLETEVLTFGRVLGFPTSVGVYKTGNPTTGGRLVFARAGGAHQILEWNGNNQELSLAAAGTGTVWQGLTSWFVGRGSKGYNVDGPPQLIQLDSPRYCRFDPNGNLYFFSKNGKGADVLRKVSTGAMPQTSTVAGGGTQAIPNILSGNVVAATDADLGTIGAVDLDRRGLVYMASGTRVLRYDPVAGTMVELYAGTRNITSMAYDANDHAVYFSYQEEPKIKKTYLPGQP